MGFFFDVKMDPSRVERVQDLPSELMFNIAMNLDYRSILALCRTRQEMNDLCRSDYLWRQLLKRDYPEEALDPQQTPRDQYEDLKARELLELDFPGWANPGQPPREEFQRLQTIGRDRDYLLSQLGVIVVPPPFPEGFIQNLWDLPFKSEMLTMLELTQGNIKEKMSLQLDVQHRILQLETLVGKRWTSMGEVDLSEANVRHLLWLIEYYGLTYDEVQERVEPIGHLTRPVRRRSPTLLENLRAMGFS